MLPLPLQSPRLSREQIYRWLGLSLTRTNQCQSQNNLREQQQILQLWGFGAISPRTMLLSFMSQRDSPYLLRASTNSNLPLPKACSQSKGSEKLTHYTLQHQDFINSRFLTHTGIYLVAPLEEPTCICIQQSRSFSRTAIGLTPHPLLPGLCY